MLSPTGILSLDCWFPLWEPVYLRIISKKQIREFVKRFPKAAEPLKHWANAVENSEWKNPVHLKAGFGTADFVGDLTVFDIGGNKHRLIAFVHYRRQVVYIKHILTHKEYDKEAWKQ